MSNVEHEQIVFEAVTRQASSEIQALSRQYRSATQGMSDDALRLAVAQDKLDKALSRHGAGSSQARQAELAYRNEIERTTSALHREASASDSATRELNQQERSLGRLSRGVAAGSGIFGGLGRSVAFASGTFLGGAGLVYALRQTLSAGRDAEASQGRVAVAVKNAGLEYVAYRDEIDRTITKQSQLSAFDDEDLADVFGKLVIRTKDVADALKLTGFAADVARGRQISLEAATSLVIKASLGQAGQLRRVGIEVGKNATAQDLLNKLTETYSGQAERYGREGAGAQERLGVAIQNTEENISTALLPTITDLSDKVADWLSDAENQERVQRDVNATVKAGAKFAHDLGSSIGFVHDKTEPLVNAVGGVEKAIELAFGAALLLKLRRAATNMGLIGGASGRTAAKGVADAERFSAAWDLATRPRNMVVTTTTAGGGVPTPTGGRPVATPGGPATPRPTTSGGGGFLGRFGRGLGTAGKVAGGIGGTALSFAAGPEFWIPVVAAGILHERFDKPPTDAQLADQRQRARDVLADPKARAAIRAQLGAAALAQLAAIAGTSAGLATRPDEGSRARPTTTASPAGGGAGGSDTGAGAAGGGRTQTDYQLDLARAGTDTARLGVLRQHDTYLDRAIAALEADKTKTGKQKQRLIQLYNERDQTDSQIQGIVDTREKASQDAQDAAETKHQAALKKAAAKRKAAQEAELKQRLADAKSLSIGAKKQLEGRFPMGDTKLDRIDAAKLQATGAGGDTVSRDEVTSLLRDFMQWQVDLVRNGSNVSGGNLGNSVMEQLMMSGNLERSRQTRALEKLAAGTGPQRFLDQGGMGW